LDVTPPGAMHGAWFGGNLEWVPPSPWVYWNHGVSGKNEGKAIGFSGLGVKYYGIRS
jgi:hypothetical protein